MWIPVPCAPPAPAAGRRREQAQRPGASLARAGLKTDSQQEIQAQSELILPLPEMTLEGTECGERRRVYTLLGSLRPPDLKPGLGGG